MMGWFSQLVRMREGRPTKAVWKTKAIGKNKRSRLTIEWNDVMALAIMSKNITWQDAEQMAQNRNEWRAFIRESSSV